MATAYRAIKAIETWLTQTAHYLVNLVNTGTFLSRGGWIAMGLPTNTSPFTLGVEG